MTCGELWRLVYGVLETQVQVSDSDRKTDDAEGEEQSILPETADTHPPDRYLGALETASRTLIPMGILYDPAGTDLRAFPLTEESRFPLPFRFVTAAVCLTGYLLDGNSRLYELYTAEYEAIRREIPGEIRRISG